MATVVTKTIKPAGGGDYTTAAAALTALTENLQAADKTLSFECYAGNMGAISLSSTLNTDTSHYVEFFAHASARHAGVFSTSSAHASSNSQTVTCNTGPSKNLKLNGLCLESTSASYSAIVAYASAAGCEIYNCVIKSPRGVIGIINAYNCIAYGGNDYFMLSLRGASSVYNCTTYGAYGFRSYDNNALVKNCLAQGSTDGFYGTFNSASDYNCSNIAEDAPGEHSATGTARFADSANNDYHLAATDTVARGAGVNLTVSGITTDIDGETRPATGAWDIGADQYAQYAAAVNDRASWGDTRFGGNGWSSDWRAQTW